MCEVLERFVVLFGLGASGAALMTDVPDNGEGRPDERHRTQHEDAVQNSHKGEDNKPRGGQESRSCFASLERGFRANTLILATDRPA